MVGIRKETVQIETEISSKLELMFNCAYNPRPANW